MEDLGDGHTQEVIEETGDSSPLCIGVVAKGVEVDVPAGEEYIKVDVAAARFSYFLV